MTGWEQPSPPNDRPRPRSYWGQANESDPLSPGRLIRAAWRLYRSSPRRFLLVAAIPAVIQAVLTLPTLIDALGFVEAIVNVFTDYFERVVANPEVYRDADPQVLQSQLEAELRSIVVPGADLLVWSAVGGGLAMVVGLVGTAALTAAALASASGRPVPAEFAFRLVAARAGLVIPIVALGVGWLVVSWLPAFLQTSAEFQTWAGAPGSPRSTLLASLLSVVGLAVVVAIVVLAVRWALYIPAVLVEALGVGSGLERAARLTRGIRVRLGVAMVGVILLLAIVAGLTAIVVGLAVGIAVGSVAVGFGAYIVVGVLGNILAAPMVPAMLALAYRERTGETVPPETVATGV